ncbi:MAG TPA: 50S ribosomal protein L23 [Anaerolineae bacterium]|nr:50S ribosomal protein L23 [Anaerolineae bacterium]HPL30742.1 50S ribosomal protein L23 [Anaerolineae bacterium]
MHPYEVLKRPLLTEKTNIQNDEENRYSFEVDRRANKLQVKDAVEKAFSVKVVAVNIINVPSKQRRLGRQVGHRPGWKKAVVKLAPGQRIQLFEGV